LTVPGKDTVAAGVNFILPDLNAVDSMVLTLGPFAKHAPPDSGRVSAEHIRLSAGQTSASFRDAVLGNGGMGAESWDLLVSVCRFRGAEIACAWRVSAPVNVN
jgi:hypothetical protein